MPQLMPELRVSGTLGVVVDPCIANAKAAVGRKLTTRVSPQGWLGPYVNTQLARASHKQDVDQGLLWRLARQQSQVPLDGRHCRRLGGVAGFRQS